MLTFSRDIYITLTDLLVKYRRLGVTFVHIVQAMLANYMAFMLRFDFSLQPERSKQFITYLPLILLIRLAIYLVAGHYKDILRYSSIKELIRLFYSLTLGSIVFFVLVRFFFTDASYPRSVYIIDWLLIIMMSGGGRLSVRVLREYMRSEHSGKRTLLIGAGDAGEMILRDMGNNPKYGYSPVGFIDDAAHKRGLKIHGVPIIGGREMIGAAIKQYGVEEILITMPSASNQTIRDIYEACKPHKIPIKTLPRLSDVLSGNISVAQIKPLSLEDLLFREVLRPEIKEVKDYLEGKTVLVTGAGGSIGSELCRQIIEHGPSNLIIFDRYENALFEIDLELRRRRKTGVSTVVGDICDAAGVERLFAKYKPAIVFHAAAHKHVPLMEGNPLEAVKNNIFGTKNVAEAAKRHNAESFVMISTDKAVNPTNIMGATKRVAEFLTMDMNSPSGTRFTTVRFGNVLGSNGSVINIFKEQLRRGGPLTVTHPEIKRFFMLIPEAVQLVLIAASAGKGGEIFVLDMGEQIKIVDLAENFIRLSGFTPYEDINIEFIGLRPGEKLYEELFDESEKTAPSFHEKLLIAAPDNIPALPEMRRHLAALELILREGSVERLMAEIRKIVPNFKKDRPLEPGGPG